MHSILLLLISLALRVWGPQCHLPEEKVWNEICSVNQPSQLRAVAEVSNFTHLPGKSHHHHCPECASPAIQMPLGNATEFAFFLRKLTETLSVTLIQPTGQSKRIALPEPRAPPSF